MGNQTKEKNHQLQANLEKPIEKIASFVSQKLPLLSRVIITTIINIKLERLREPENEFSKHAISVNTEETQRNEQKKFVRHMPDALSEMVFKLLFEWRVLNITTKITGKHRRAPEGTWVPGGTTMHLLFVRSQNT